MPASWAPTACCSSPPRSTADELIEFHRLATEIGLDVLVEIHDEPELEVALAAGATLIGVNQRDLVTFQVDHERAVRMAGLMPDRCGEGRRERGARRRRRRRARAPPVTTRCWWARRWSPPATPPPPSADSRDATDIVTSESA